MIRPVFADGPLRGCTDISIRNLSQRVCAIRPLDPGRHPDEIPVQEMREISDSQVVYRFVKYQLFGRVVTIGVCGDPESAEVQGAMWDLLTSPACKAAAEGTYVFRERAG